jgi:hypothetical protein
MVLTFNSLGSGPKNLSMTWQGWEQRAADSLVVGISSTSLIHISYTHWNFVAGFSETAGILG